MLELAKLKRLVLCSTIFVFALQTHAQQRSTYWVEFKDKSNCPYKISDPSKYLSLRAINRRKKNKVEISENDLPVSKQYVDSLNKMGVRVLYTSKWFNAATIEVDDETIIPSIQKISFISLIQKTRNASITKIYKEYSKNEITISKDDIEVIPNDYGKGLTQIDQLHGLFLHNKGFKGSSILIALIDAGYLNANNYLGLSQTFKEGKVLATHDFVNSSSDIYSEHRHGAIVLSSIASNLKDSLIGTAPEASFLLLRGEDSQSEYPVECDNWIAAAEFADSCGADIISSSLGYKTFDDSTMNFTYNNLNGKTVRSSTAAEIASSKGMIVLVSAGNDGDNPWHYIGSPADAKEILTIGAINSTEKKASFSSFGPTADGRIKPNVMAMGETVIAELSPGKFSTISGTSLSCPIAAGLVACLIQAFPNATTKAIKQAILQSANQYTNPDNAMGYGIPDFEKAYEILQDSSTINSLKAYAFPNPFNSELTIVNQYVDEEKITIECFAVTGEKLFSTNKEGGFTNLNENVKYLSKGSYIFRCISKGETISIKAIKL
jgi:serine protease AprX